MPNQVSPALACPATPGRLPVSLLCKVTSSWWPASAHISEGGLLLQIPGSAWGALSRSAPLCLLWEPSR